MSICLTCTLPFWPIFTASVNFLMFESSTCNDQHKLVVDSTRFKMTKRTDHFSDQRSLLVRTFFFLTYSQIKEFIKSVHLFGGAFAIITICSSRNFLASVLCFISG